MFLFFAYSFLGWVGEVLYTAVTRRRYQDRGVLSGPLCILYGIGAHLISFTLRDLSNDSWFFLAVFSAVYATVIEWVAGHILGSALVNLMIEENGKKTKLIFTGDIGQPNVPILDDPHQISGADFIITESTYGNRLHEQVDREKELCDVMKEALSRGGNVIIPAFAVGRTQVMLYYFQKLMSSGQLPVVPIMVDSPMAIKATQVMLFNPEEYDEEARTIFKKQGGRLIDMPNVKYTETAAESKAINDMLDRVNAAYSAQMQFVSDASHELRTPIAVIQGYAALLDRWGKDDPEARQEAIDAIRSESDAMERLVEQLLFLARGDNDTQPIRPQLMDLTAVAEDVLREEQMIHPERAFLARWQGPVVVRADPGLVKQVMRILMDNSVKYSGPEGRVYLRVSAQKDYARVTVQDEGMGIVPQAIPHIFDRFYRTDSSRARQTGGTGLGLSIARWIVDRHGGWFEVVSREDVGTRITFVLPLEGTA